MVDVARDQRWGRVAEGSGEDVYLGKLFAAARVRGYQGSSLANEDSMLATPKHFAAYGAVSGGMDYNHVEISGPGVARDTPAAVRGGLRRGRARDDERVQRRERRACEREQRAAHRRFCAASGDFAGSSSPTTRRIASSIAHGYAEGPRDATKLAFLAGVDMSMQSGFYARYLPALVQSGEVPSAKLDDAVRRVLQVKKALGLFDNPYRSLDPAREAADLDRPRASRARARGRAPLDRDAAQRASRAASLPNRERRFDRAVRRGARAARTGRGRCSRIRASRSRSRTGIRAALGAPAQLTVVPGSGFDTPIDGGIEAAVEAANAADVVLLAIGESAGHVRGGGVAYRDRRAAPRSRRSPKPSRRPANRSSCCCATAVRSRCRAPCATRARSWLRGFSAPRPATPSPTSCSGITTRPGGCRSAFRSSRDRNRSITTTAPRAARTSTAGMPRSRRAIARCRTSRLYPFGYGLSYSSFAYGPVKLSSATLAWDGSIRVSARITNTSTRAGEEVVQLYVHDRVASLTRPVRELKGVPEGRSRGGREPQT